MFKDDKSHGEPQIQHPSLDGMIEWLQTKDPEMKYMYLSWEKCLCAQYYREKTDEVFSAKYMNGNPMASFLNFAVAACREDEIDCYNVKAALRRAIRCKEYDLERLSS